jgi:dual specificity tyrosine-phosphorylation-regulated kinase 2/3/4
LGQAQFSNAIEVMDLTNKQRYCLKIIQNNKEYFDQSLDEIKILKYIKANCNPDEKCLLNLHDYFYHKEHLMLMTELLKDTLLHAYRMNREMFSNLRNIQIISRQLLIGL